MRKKQWWMERRFKGLKLEGSGQEKGVKRVEEAAVVDRKGVKSVEEVEAVVGKKRGCKG